MKSPSLLLSIVAAVAMTFGVSTSAVEGQCPADLNGDGQINQADVAQLLENSGPVPFPPVPTWATLLQASPDPAVVTDANLRAAIVASGLAWRIKDTSSNIEMVLVPAGTFTMGCSASTQYACYSENESPTHQVTLSAFYIGRYEVTQAQWTATMGSNPSYFSGYSDSPSRPVEKVSWDMIASGSTSFMSLTGLRLPTEPEWEYAYRAGTTTAFHSYPAQPTGFNDDTLLDNIAWYTSNSGNQTHAVGGKLANGLGLHDMSGNVLEWCQNWYGPYSSGSVTNPSGPATGTNRLLRGGSFNNESNFSRSSQRRDYPWVSPSYAYLSVGFRAARDVGTASTVSSVLPNFGSTLGGTAITITGANLTGASSVTVGEVAATSVVVVSSTSVTAVTPAGTVGAQSVAVTTPSRTTTATNAFTYFGLPTVSSVSPNFGSALGGTAITITGANLTGGSSVTVGGVAATSVVVVSSTSVTAVTPAGTVGARSVAVTTPIRTATATNAFTYFAPPTVSLLSPTSGSMLGGTAITITGANLTGTSSVTVGGVPATNVVAVNSTTVTAVTPAGSVGAASVEVTGAEGTATATNAFTYIFDVVPAWATLLEIAPDPTVVTDANLRAAIVASGLAWRIRDNTSNIEMLLVPGGTFMMGCGLGFGECGGDENPAHQVTLTQAFYMGKTEVTQAQWTATMGSNPSYFISYSDSPSRPVEQVSWDTIQIFNSVTGLRLPTEAEWEHAYRAGTTTAFHSFPAQPTGFNFNDGSLPDNIMWYNENAGSQTHAAGGKYANALGLHDMSGNVLEWCQDWHRDYSSGSATNPTGPTTGGARLLRGGDWDLPATICTSSQRFGIYPAYANKDIGFRVARNP